MPTPARPATKPNRGTSAGRPIAADSKMDVSGEKRPWDDSEADDEEAARRAKRRARQAAIMEKYRLKAAAAQKESKETAAAAVAAPKPAHQPPPAPAAAAVASSSSDPPRKPRSQSDTFDMFSDAAGDAPVAAVPTKSKVDALFAAEGNNMSLVDNWVDPEGYYLGRVGEVLNERYRVCGNHGKGVFSVVLFCQDRCSNDERVAVKVIRANDTMRRAGQKELGLLREIAAADPQGRRHCVRMSDSFEFRNHLCLVFEPMAMNLREVLHKYGKGIGINLDGVQKYAKQLFVALRLLEQLEIVHADLKPDNILVNEALTTLKICDLGSAFKTDDPENLPTPYLVSRFYRAPEISLGLPYSTPIDTWAAATCLFELFTGKVMFPGKTNNEMLKLQMDTSGRFPNRMVRRHLASYETLEKVPHFEPDFRFRQASTDIVSKKEVLRLVVVPDHPAKGRDVASKLVRAAAKGSDRLAVQSLGDLLSRCLHLDPSRRPSVKEVLLHPFITPPPPPQPSAPGAKAESVGASSEPNDMFA